MLNYRASKSVVRSISLSNVPSNKIQTDWVKDRVILIGVSAPISSDDLLTPYGRVSGVMVQTQTVSQILSAVLDRRPLLQTLNKWQETFWIWGWSIIGGTIAWYWGRIGVKSLAIVMASVILRGICWILLIQGVWLPLIPSLFVLVIPQELSDGRGKSVSIANNLQVYKGVSRNGGADCRGYLGTDSQMCGKWFPH